MGEPTGGEKYYPDLSGKIDYSSSESAYGKPDQVVLKLLEGVKGKIVFDPTIGDGKYVTPLLQQGNTIIGGDYDKTPDKHGTLPLKALEKRFPEAFFKEGKLTLRSLNAFEPYPIADGSIDVVLNTGFLYLFPGKDPQNNVSVEHNVKETARVLKSGGLFVFDFATDIQRTLLDSAGEDTGQPVPQATTVQYTTEQATALIRELLADEFEEPEIVVSHIDEKYPQSGYRMRNTKLNVRAKRK